MSNSVVSMSRMSFKEDLSSAGTVHSAKKVSLLPESDGGGKLNTRATVMNIEGGSSLTVLKMKL